MITYKGFEVINTMLKSKEKIYNVPEFVYSNVHYYAFKSQDEVAELVQRLEEKGYIADGQVTVSGLKEIEPLRVNNAVILAAGGRWSGHFCKICLQHAGRSFHGEW